MVRSGKSYLNPVVRSLAGATVFLFLAAQVLCLVHCGLGDGQPGDDSHDSPHGTASAVAHDHSGDASDSSHHDSSEQASCITLKTALVNDCSLALNAPEFGVLYTLAPFALPQNAVATEPAALSPRHAARDDWVFTPEVSLGPAFRSLAPPLI